ncbi:tetratricopeptide repeat protein [Lysobacter sp. CFH 32150]|uniref:tetratricopeptide repeat protein n=1 Tax=Lysobacter sp. CFH 32150 TaxID=2927128 RepID=UPI001FA774B9|nr:tetratricopeptide repeat protein [Lysobacter sp. CFH 32150]MCI4567736.1 tetratricopeptide repeat protein [Lysobacter sp. CFH 32150]
MIRRHWPWLGLIALLLATWLAYLPGLAGDFLFDDFVNLPAIGATGPVDDWATFWRYLTSGSADPTGRPLALLSFLLDARTWPAGPAPFLRTNLCLHLLNGALLFALLRLLGRRLDSDAKRNDAAALLGSGLWLLHPLFVSTTLYVIQREAMLPATFTLLGLLGYVHGRDAYDRGRQRAGLAWMLASISIGTVLALLSKANGVLLPLLAWTLETTVLRHNVARQDVDSMPKRSLHWLRLGLLVLPSVLIAGYVASHLTDPGAVMEQRTWTIGQRLLTEPRVLTEYLQLLVVPRALSTGLYNEDYIASIGLLAPPSTLACLVLIGALIGVGFALRQRMPALSVALLFYFAGHLLESSAIPLELYYEHRNYLPALLLFWPLARALCAWRAPVVARTTIAIALLALLATTTHQRAQLWGKPDQQAALWAYDHPESSRAQATAAAWETRGGRPDLAMSRLAPLWRQRPHDLQLALNYANTACALRGLSPLESAAVAQALQQSSSEGEQLVYRWLDRALGVASDRSCPGLDFATVEQWLRAAQNNPRLSGQPGRQQELHGVAGRLALQRGQPGDALSEFDRALAAYTTPGAAAQQAAILATHGHYALALAHLDTYERLMPHAPHATGWNMPRLHEWVLDRQGYWPRELALLRKKLRAEMAVDSRTDKVNDATAQD